MKTYKTENVRQVNLDELVADNPVVPQDAAQVETAWDLMQTDLLDSGNGRRRQKRGALGGGNHSVIRRFEIYKYAGVIDAAVSIRYDSKQSLLAEADTRSIDHEGDGAVVHGAA